MLEDAVSLALTDIKCLPVPRIDQAITYHCKRSATPTGNESGSMTFLLAVVCGSPIVASNARNAVRISIGALCVPLYAAFDTQRGVILAPRGKPHM
jgi:hypothetical protein